jgi:hypothetical protein
MSKSPVVIHLNGAKGHAKPIRVGDTYHHPITYVDGAGAPIDKGAPIVWLAQIRSSYRSPLIVATFDVVVSGAFDNIVSINLTEDVTLLLEPGSYVWDLEQRTPGVPDDEVLTKVEGDAIIKSDVSRAA